MLYVTHRTAKKQQIFDCDLNCELNVVIISLYSMMCIIFTTCSTMYGDLLYLSKPFHPINVLVLMLHMSSQVSQVNI